MEPSVKRLTLMFQRDAFHLTNGSAEALTKRRARDFIWAWPLIRPSPLPALSADSIFQPHRSWRVR